MNQRIILSIFFIFIFTGCLEQSGSTTEGVIPDVTMECSQAQVYAPYCRNSGEILWMGITDEFELDCASVLASFSSSVRNDYFVAIAENVSVTHAGTLVRANVTNWVTPLGAGAGNLLEGTYKVCAFIEAASGNDRLDLGEPLGAGLLTVSSSSAPQLVNDWISY